MESAGLTQMLEQEGSYTVFAPTDDAFNGLSEEDLTLLTGRLNRRNRLFFCSTESITEGWMNDDG